MYSFDQLVSDSEFIEDDKIKDFLEDFFVKENLDQYFIDNCVDSKHLKSIQKMFISNEDILLRAKNVLKQDEYCLEAFYIFYRLADETVLNFTMNNIYHKKNQYEMLSKYEKYSVINILNFYVQFLLDIHNLTFAIKVLKTIIKLENNYSTTNISKLSYLYCLLENKKDFYDLYINEYFSEPIPYILLMVVLLKHEEELKAKEVYLDMLKKFKYATYIDHIWDLEEINEEESIEFKNAVDICFEEICAIPYFFSWCQENKEETYRS